MRDLSLECAKEYTYTVRQITPARHDGPDRKLLHRCVFEVDPHKRLVCQVPENVPVRQHGDSQPLYGCGTRCFDTRGGDICFYACAYQHSINDDWPSPHRAQADTRMAVQLGNRSRAAILLQIRGRSTYEPWIGCDFPRHQFRVT